MNTYALALARKWTQLASEYKSFNAFSKSVGKAAYKLEEIDKLSNRLKTPKHMLEYFFSDAIPMAIPSFFICLLISYFLPFELNFITASLITLGLYTVTFLFRYFYMLPRTIQKEKEELKKITQPFDYSVSYQLYKSENLQKILPILEMYLVEDAIKDILIHFADNCLTYDDVNLIFVALNKYYKENITSQNFIYIMDEVNNENVTYDPNQSKKSEITDSKTQDEQELENIRFFVK